MLWFFGLAWLFGLAFVPIIQRLRAQQEACNPPLQVKVTGVDGQSNVVRVPSPALSYYAQNLGPLLAVWIGLQFIFAALLSSTEPDLPYALACYHTVLTAAGVGSEVQATSPAAKWVMVAQIIVSIGTLSIICQVKVRVRDRGRGRARFRVRVRVTVTVTVTVRVRVMVRRALDHLSGSGLAGERAQENCGAAATDDAQERPGAPSGASPELPRGRARLQREAWAAEEAGQEAPSIRTRERQQRQ